MTPVKGKNVYIEFDIGGFKKYGCAQTVAAEGQANLRSVKTKGDGRHKRWKQFDTQHSISLTGLMVFDDANMVTPVELAEYWKAGVEVSYRMYFDADDGTHLSGLYGIALVETFNLNGDTRFGRASFTFRGQGELNIGLPPVCTKAITSMNLTRVGLTFRWKVQILSLNQGTVPTYHYSVDSGDFLTANDTVWTFDVSQTSNFLFGPHKLEIWPVCENGVRGTKTERTFVILFGL